MPIGSRYVSALSAALGEALPRARAARPPSPGILLSGKPHAAGHRAAAGRASLERVTQASADPQRI